ncbi:MAG: hypothetical protein GC156_10640 [Actinomycetales bacterium]|nr:hypothetical protein [Actinomycetales bacterium]
MGEDGTPEETSGVDPTPTEPTPEEPGAEAAPMSGSSAEGGAPTQELPALTDAPPPEEPAAEEPVAEEPVAEEPVTEEPAAEEPVTEEPVAEEPAAEEPVAEEPVTAEPVSAAAALPAVEGPAHAAPRRKRSVWRPILATIASLAILAGVGLAGFAYGRSSAPGPDIVVQPGPVTEVGADAQSLPQSVMPSTIAPVLTVRKQALGAPAAVLTAAPGLEDNPGTAMGFRLINSGISGAQVASVLATTFGVKGSTIQQDDTWTVGKDGAPQVVVTDDALFSWTYRDPQKLAAPEVGQQLEPADAIDLANTLLANIGVDTNSVDWQVDRYFDRTAVTAWQLVADQRTQLRWLVAFDPKGAVVEASGFSAGLDPVASYPVVGAATAVKRSTTAPWWTLGATLIAPAPDGATAPTVAPVPTDQVTSPTTGTISEPPAVPSLTGGSGDPVFGSSGPEASASAVPSTVPSAAPSVEPVVPDATQPGLVVRVDDVTVTEAAMGLAQYWEPDGSVLMLPSYVLTGDDGSTWSLIAVADQYVDFIPSTDPVTGGGAS